MLPALATIARLCCLIATTTIVAAASPVVLALVLAPGDGASCADRVHECDAPGGRSASHAAARANDPPDPEVRGAYASLGDWRASPSAVASLGSAVFLGIVNPFSMPLVASTYRLVGEDGAVPGNDDQEQRHAEATVDSRLPEPGTLVILGLALVVVALRRRRRGCRRGA